MSWNDNLGDEQYTFHGVKLSRTSTACPEQYDALMNGEIVGYLRLRGGVFSVECPDVGGRVVHTACPFGDGVFEADEREPHLKRACEEILRFMGKPTQSMVDEAWNEYAKLSKQLTGVEPTRAA